MASFSSENPPASYIRTPSPQTPLGAVAGLNHLSSSRPALTRSSQAMAHIFLLHGLIPTGRKHAVSFPTIKPTVSPDLPFLSHSGRFSPPFQPEHPRKVVARGLPFRSPSAPSVGLTPRSRWPAPFGVLCARHLGSLGSTGQGRSLLLSLALSSLGPLSSPGFPPTWHPHPLYQLLLPASLPP